MKTNILAIGFLLLAHAVVGTAQPIGKALLPEVTATGFYAIDLPYQVIGPANSDLSDLRLLDAKGLETAFFIRRYVIRNEQHEFIPYPIELTTTSRSTEVMITTGGKSVSSFTLQIKNADADKEASLRGSNDRNTWYVVKDYLRLANNYTVNETEVLVPLTFPLSDYNYYRLSVSDSLSAPLNIVAVGTMKNESAYAEQLWAVPPTSSSITTVGKQTEIKQTFDYKYNLSDIAFYISGPRFYNREIEITFPRIAEPQEERRSMRKRYRPMPPPSYYEILQSENGSPQFLSFNERADTLTITIDNGDDRPLTIDSVHACIQRQQLIAWLEKGTTYRLMYADETAIAPAYDLSFKAQVPDSIPILSVLSPQLDTKALAARAAGQSTNAWLDFFKSYGIWIIIFAVIAQILYMVQRITRQKK